MSLSDPIADMLTVLRNANHKRMKKCLTPYSKMKEAVLSILKEEGYIASFEKVTGRDKHPKLVMDLKYGSDGERVFTEIKRISKSGGRIYNSAKDIKPVYDGLGIRIVSTSVGVISDKKCREKNVGGEVICQVF
jgi:small subunit ribosomal protein S8